MYLDLIHFDHVISYPYDLPRYIIQNCLAMHAYAFEYFIVMWCFLLCTYIDIIMNMKTWWSLLISSNVCIGVYRKSSSINRNIWLWLFFINNSFFFSYKFLNWLTVTGWLPEGFRTSRITIALILIPFQRFFWIFLVIKIYFYVVEWLYITRRDVCYTARQTRVAVHRLSCLYVCTILSPQFIMVCKPSDHYCGTENQISFVKVISWHSRLLTVK